RDPAEWLFEPWTRRPGGGAPGRRRLLRVTRGRSAPRRTAGRPRPGEGPGPPPGTNVPGHGPGLLGDPPDAPGRHRPVHPAPVRSRFPRLPPFPDPGRIRSALRPAHGDDRGRAGPPA